MDAEAKRTPGRVCSRSHRPLELDISTLDVTNRSASTLPKVMGWGGVMLYTVGFTIGSGIFRVPAEVARYAGSTSWMTWLWLGGFILAAASAAFTLELAIRFPRSGGNVIYLREAYGPGLTFVYGIGAILFLPAAAAAVARTFADYLGSVVTLTEAELRSVAALVLAIHTLLAVRSTRLAARFISVATVAKIAALLFVLIVCFGRRAQSVAATSIDRSPSLTALMLGFIPVLWAFNGSTSAVWIAGEVSRPGRNLLIGMVSGTAIVATLYLLLNLGFVHALGFERLSQSTAVAADAMRVRLGHVGALVIACVVMGSTFVTNGAQLLGHSRQFYALSRQGLLFHTFGRLHASWQTPWLAVLLEGGVAIALTLLGNFAIFIRLNFLAAFPFYVLVALATVRLRKTQGAPPEFRMPFYPWPVIVYTLIAVPIWVSGIRDTPRLAALGIGILLTAGAAYVIWRRSAAATATHPD
jgi:basic amino acid/polyamine antiporter, APA family